MTEQTFAEAADELQKEEVMAANTMGVDPRMLQHIAEISKVPSTHATVFSAFVTQHGTVRVTYGDQIHPQVPPVFSGAVTTTFDAVKGLHGLLGNLIGQMEAALSGLQGTEDAGAVAGNAKPN
jgi:hypothetical protein